MIKKILKISGIILLLLLLAGLVYWLNIKMSWPWWVGAAIYAGIIGLVLGIVFLRRYLLRRREKKFVRRVVELDDAAIKDLPIRERQQLQELQDKWKEAVELLRDSYLRKRGNPLYALPWYLVIGESGSGKTTAIKSARLNSPLTDIARTAGIAATRNCDWWFFEEAIILDSAGRYTIPIEEAADREEWEKFLGLLSQYRRREPLNGLIVTAAADTILSGSKDKLRLDGQSIRKRIDQLMRVVGAKFPVYILVTKMDMVFGFGDFFLALPEGYTSQAMGYINRKQNPYWHEVLDEAWSNITQRLRELRLTLVNLTGADTPPAALVFPGEFERLRPGLESFFKAVFSENPYQETPPLRGIYFSSARQAGAPPFCPLPGYTYQPAGGSRDEESRRDFFLKDIFGTILPGDRNLFSPIMEFVRWRRLTGNTALVAILLICLSLAGLLTMSFLHNRAIIENFFSEYDRQHATVGTDEGANLIIFERLRRRILDLEKDNRRWFLPRLGLDESLEMEEKIKEEYARAFRSTVIAGFDRRFIKRLDGVTGHTPEDELADCFSYTVSRLNILQDFLKSGKVKPSTAFKKSASDVIVAMYPQTPPDIAALYADNYYAYLSWTNQKIKLETDRDFFHAALASLEERAPDLKWLVRKWIPEADDVLLKNFWGEPESTGFHTNTIVAGAYTAQGRKNIEAFLKEVEAATADKSWFDKRRNEFWKWYQQQFINAWTVFARNFSEGEGGLQTQASQRTMATLMTTDKSPYFLLLQRIAEESAWIEEDRLPPWIAVLIDINEIHKLSKRKLQTAGKSLVGKIQGEVRELSREFGSEAGREKIDTVKRRLAAVKIWDEFLENLDKIEPAATSQEVAYRMAADFFTLPADTKESKAAIYQVYSSYLKLKGTLALKGDLTDAWDILIGPIDFLINYCIRQTACYLKQQWEGQIVGGIQGATPDKVPALLFDKTNGLVWKYLDGPANSFITKSRVGYVPRKAAIRTGYELSVPFTRDFFVFLNKGAEGVLVAQPDYPVTMETLPIEVNDGAGVDPYANILTLKCTDAQVTLKNYNYPQKTSFRWTPDKCGDTTLQIMFNNLTLTKTYGGQMGFANFLVDFQNGSKTYGSGDFPEAATGLKGMGVTSIKVSYKISGAKPILALLKKVPAGVPLEIVKCEAY
ncbi:MAG TPA: type VI secretion protein IcmF/TssM N-terminal domain-containing protein [Syntrophales bacterium]|nr:type VI secretion protein IcmF/TssM N-terminal domain-containing protein [Syntrophales bacterium]HQI35747.1 type VI secretion protein IcmF/TssM N-terminal domain-containing protein [Syntrophales bacterium]